MNFNGTIELETSTRATIALFDSRGELLCCSRIDGRDLYERGYSLLSNSAESKGGRLDRYTKVSQ